jgi:RecB family exonuclease
MKMQNRLPFQKFPGLMMILDSYTKRLVHEHYDRYHRIPNWFKPFGDLETPVHVPHHSKFFILDKETNIRLSGVPDAIFKCKDNTYCIIDYKTARWSQTQEDILPMYRVQLNGYAYIAEQVDLFGNFSIFQTLISGSLVVSTPMIGTRSDATCVSANGGRYLSSPAPDRRKAFSVSAASHHINLYQHTLS